MSPKFFNFREAVTSAKKRFSARVFIDPLENDFEQITYADLDHFVNCYAEFLKVHQIPEMEKIAFISETTTISALLFVGSIACDRVFVPINPGLAKSEILRLLDQVTPGLIICGQAQYVYCEAWASHNGAQTLKLDDGYALYSSILSVESPKPFKSKCCASDVAEIVFTSGSSGGPKGVVLSHGALIANAWGLARRYGISSEDHFFVSVPIFHCGGQIFPTLCPLLLGAQTTVAEPKVALMRFWEISERHQITWSILITVFLPVLLQSPPQKTLIKGLLVGGSAVSASLIGRFEEKFGIAVSQIYGMTEVAAVIVSEPLSDPLRSPGSVGRPTDIASVRIVSEDLQPVSAGVTGEICLRSASCYQGYYKDTAATTARELDGHIRTGDTGYIDEKGNLHVLGRLDDMFNVNGENVYPAEIEAIAPDLDGIEAMMIVNVPSEATDNEVVMLYKMRPGETPVDQLAWDQAFRERLSYRKIPTHRIDIASFGLSDWHLTGSGKIDRRRMKLLTIDFFEAL